MKRLIRNGVFETNSSSSHSVSVSEGTKEFILDSLYPDENGSITIHGQQFGWEWFKHNDALTKAQYAAQQFKNNENVLDLLKELIIEQTGAQDVIFQDLDDGYVDHDSVGILESNKDWLKDFIFNKNSWLFGGNDNDTPDPMFYDVVEYKDGKEIVPVYQYELSVDGFNKTTKFKTEPTEEEINDGLYSLLSGVYLSTTNEFSDDNSIEAQIFRHSVPTFKFDGWKMPTNHEEKTLYFVKDAWSDAHERWKREFGNQDWASDLGYRKCREIEMELFNQPNSPYVKPVRYRLTKLFNGSSPFVNKGMPQLKIK